MKPAGNCAARRALAWSSCGSSARARVADGLVLVALGLRSPVRLVAGALVGSAFLAAFPFGCGDAGVDLLLALVAARDACEAVVTRRSRRVDRVRNRLSARGCRWPSLGVASERVRGPRVRSRAGVSDVPSRARGPVRGALAVASFISAIVFADHLVGAVRAARAGPDPCASRRRRSWRRPARSGWLRFGVVVRHIVPNLLGVVAVQLGGTAAAAIVVSEAALSFVGFGTLTACRSVSVLDQGVLVDAAALPRPLGRSGGGVRRRACSLMIAGRAFDRFARRAGQY